jgi:hypothetical protein
VVGEKIMVIANLRTSTGGLAARLSRILAPSYEIFSIRADKSRHDE